MVRPCFLVIDNQYPASISARKLVIETAMLNVITAYSAQEAVDTLTRYPAVDGVVLDTSVRGMSCAELIALLRTIRREVPIVTVSPSGHSPCGGEQHHISSYDPKKLLECLQSICTPEVMRAAEEGNLPGC